MWRRDEEKARTGPHARAGGGGGGARDGGEAVEVQSVQLVGMFAAPAWLRDLGMMAWLLVGVAALLVGAIAILSITNTIVVPVITASIIAAVLSPAVGLLQRRGVGRGAGTAIVFLAVVVGGAAMAVLILGSVVSRASGIEGALDDATTAIQGWVQDLGVSKEQAQEAKADASSGVSNAFHALLSGLGVGIKALASLAIFLSFTLLSLFFLLKDGPLIRRWAEAHMGVPRAVASTVTGRTLQSLRQYFLGVTVVAAFNAIIIGVAAVVLGVSEAGAIAVVNFVAAYIPYLGAWSAGAFTVLLALASQGTSAALIMAVVVLLANGALQQMIQPIAFGATLGIHPLAVLIVTIAGGSLFGGVGLILAAPLTSAAVHISADLARGRAAEEEAADAGARAPARARRPRRRRSPALTDMRRPDEPPAGHRDPAGGRRGGDRRHALGATRRTGGELLHGRRPGVGRVRRPRDRVRHLRRLRHPPRLHEL